jgi:hypothetical protein
LARAQGFATAMPGKRPPLTSQLVEFIEVFLTAGGRSLGMNCRGEKYLPKAFAQAA